MSSEARVHPRLRLSVTADIIGDEVVLARPLADVSLGGCRFDGPAWESEGSEVKLVLSFAAAQIPVDAVIVRSSETDMGVRFHSVTDEQKWALRKHIREATGH